MKQFFIITISLLFIGCTKDITDAEPISIADAYIGSYNVVEDVSVLWDNSFHQQNSFVGEIIKGDSSNRIKFIQSARSPKPVWSHGWSDTIVYEINSLTDSLVNPYSTIAVGKIINKDVLKTQYLYIQGVGYQVHQTWARKK